MTALDTLLILFPIASYVILMLSLQFGWVKNLIIGIVLIIAVTILGIVSISTIQPIDMSASDLQGIASNIITITYVAAVIYGAWGVRGGRVERTIVGGVIIAVMSLMAAVI